MENLGQAALRAARSLTSSGQQAPAVPITTTEGLPSTFVRSTDRDIPDRTVTRWTGTGEERGEPVLRRALTSDERAAVAHRRDELRNAVAPAPEASRNMLLRAIKGMLGAYPAMQRYDDGTATAIAANYLWTVREEPHWAIAKACDEVRSAAAGLNPSFAPTEPEFATVVAKLVATYRQRLAQAEAVLRAGVDKLPAPPLTKEEIEAKLGRPIGERPNPLWPEEAAGGHAERVAADLAARKARQGARTTNEDKPHDHHPA